MSDMCRAAEHARRGRSQLRSMESTTLFLLIMSSQVRRRLCKWHHRASCVLGNGWRVSKSATTGQAKPGSKGEVSVSVA